jgi:S-adenosylmethionine:tRNA ribosyltransferase-isomerase
MRRASGGRIVAIGSTSLRLLEARPMTAARSAVFGRNLDLHPRGYRFRAVDVMLTNSICTLDPVVHVAALAGDTVQRAYAHAIAAGYRFWPMATPAAVSAGS